MKIQELQTESYLFEDSDGQFRAIPFSDLSSDEIVVYEDKKPKYLIDLKGRQFPLIQDLRIKLDNGEEIEDIVWKLGRFLGKKWTTKHNIIAKEISGSQQNEKIELLLLEDLAELFIDLIFVATDKIDVNILLNENKLFETYLTDDLGLESSYIDNFENLVKMLTFLFQTPVTLNMVDLHKDKKIYDLTPFKHSCISTDQLEEKFEEWINQSGRENNMDEYGNFIGVIGYISRNKDKKNLLLITENRKHWA